MRSTCFAILTACLAVPPAVQAQGPAPAAGAAGPAGSEAAPAVTPFAQATAEEAVRELADRLEDTFLFPDKGVAYATMLRTNLAAGKYSSYSDSKAFADAVTSDLQQVYQDRHLRVHVVPPQARSGPAAERGGPSPGKSAITKSGWIADGVAYVAFGSFPGNEPTLQELRQFIDAHSAAKTLIIDARQHRGGGLAEMDVLFPELFAKETLLVSMDTRKSVAENNGDPDENRPSLRKASAPESVVRRDHYVTPAAKPRLADAKVYLLTSGRSASAAEHLALSLKRTQRATLVGETTRGAGNYGMMTPLDSSFTYAAFIPFGRTFDPDTGDGWEGVGVKPDVAVPADKALDEALRLAGVAKSGEAALVALK